MPDHRRTLGAQGETLAAAHLAREGYRIVDRNVRADGVELDLVAARGRLRVFVEVKTRGSRRLGLPEEADAERRLYERFKADEDADAILGPYLRDHPGDNRMRQPIHEQVSVPAGLQKREWELRAEAGEPNVVLPGEAAEYARRMVERGERRLREGKGSDRPQGPVEAGEVRPVRLEDVARGTR